MYISETKKKLMTRTIEYQQDRMYGKNQQIQVRIQIQATEHYSKCHGQFIWLRPKILSREARYKTLIIKRSRWDSSKSHINSDDSNLVKTNTWTLLLRDINDLERALPNQKRHYKAYLTTY